MQPKRRVREIKQIHGADVPPSHAMTSCFRSAHRWVGSLLAALVLAALLPPTQALSVSTSAIVPGAPIVEGVAPDSGSREGYTHVTISGANFREVTGVTFGGERAIGFAVLSESLITASSPREFSSAFPPIVDVTVQSAGGTSEASPADRFAYRPIIDSMSPDHGPAEGGTAVTIRGQGLGGATAVDFGSSAATTTADSESSLTAIAPTSFDGESARAYVTVTTSNGLSTTREIPDLGAKNAFTFGPAVTGLQPASGPASGGTVVTISGNGFWRQQEGFHLPHPFVTGVRFGAQSASFEVRSNGAILAIAPPGSGNVDVTVEAWESSPAIPADRFSYGPVKHSHINRAERLAQALRICARERSRHRRLRCEAIARRLYGPRTRPAHHRRRRR
jgi:hypothetical protein